MRRARPHWSPFRQNRASATAVFVSLVLLAQACPCELPSGVDPLEQPGDVLAEGLHGSQGFFVLLDFVFGAADSLFLTGCVEPAVDEPDIPACPLDLPDRTS